MMEVREKRAEFVGLPGPKKLKLLGKGGVGFAKETCFVNSCRMIYLSDVGGMEAK